MKVAANGIELDVEDDGAGVPVVLVMGLGMQRIAWPEGLLSRWRSQGLRLLTFDNRDVGASTWLRGESVPPVPEMMARALLGLPLRVPYTLAEMADDVAGMLDALGLADAHLVGVSMGGMIAQTFALRHPARARSLTSIMSTSGARWGALRTRPEGLRALLGKPPRTEEEASQRLVEVMTVLNGPGSHPMDEAALRAQGALAFRRGSNPAGFLRQLGAILASGSRQEALRGLTLPALVVHGAQDPLLHASLGRDTAARIPRARYLELGGMGHALPPGVWQPLADAVLSLVREAEARAR